MTGEPRPESLLQALRITFLAGHCGFTVQRERRGSIVEPEDGFDNRLELATAHALDELNDVSEIVVVMGFRFDWCVCQTTAAALEARAVSRRLEQLLRW